MSALIVTGTDTGIGKTIFSAGLVQALAATYWKPVQSGLEEETDSQIVARLSGRPVLPEGYLLQLPASPHLSAESEGVEIDPDTLDLPDVDGVLVAEGAGGLMVPLNRKALYLDLFARWGAPVILCARTQLGTINHTLLSLKALRGAGCPVVGVVFIGDPEPAVEETICQFGKAAHLGRLPVLGELTSDALAVAFQASIQVDLIKAALAQGEMA
ncbi:dethiobiotin synthetase BioD [Phaeobacter piscinae]|uniref:ATP-dependent dethiobiotin synthetase BioD n=1 Tax=Phaeobacter piscinae TaxID=1580596 RepID=A0ABM6PBE8_9RHOB|nr:dethiobiotin synthase [Phaeobacter piscinae]ATG34990.1 dethiobiotin synthetase BioD [Phaeobacter piscinae]AUQ85510.1 dethiobiotin synthetase BioD [Phaeobacter piscinae]AUR23394.1 dethiobiotin synthetase BioD [Phaeobacter piscinae]